MSAVAVKKRVIVLWINRLLFGDLAEGEMPKAKTFLKARVSDMGHTGRKTEINRALRF